MLGELNAKVGREEAHKGTTGGDSSHETNNDIGYLLVSALDLVRHASHIGPFTNRRRPHRTPASLKSIDDVPIERRAAANILCVSTFLGATQGII